MTRAMGLFAAALTALVFATTAHASITIQEFTTEASESGAGRHPDLTTRFKLAEPGVLEVAKDVAFEAPEGVFGNPNAITECSAANFALNECSPNSQVGLVTISAKTESSAEELLGTTPIYMMSPELGETARMSFVVPTLEIPIAVPISVRTAGDYGLRFKVTEISQLTPLASVKLEIWGTPAAQAHESSRFPKGSPGNPPGCPGLEDTGCLSELTPASVPPEPLVDYPSICTGHALPTELMVRSYQHPGEWSRAQSSYDPVTGCGHQAFNPVLSASLTTKEADSASGLNLSFDIPQPLTSNVPAPSEGRSVTVTLPPDLTINPDAADGQSACSDAEAGFGTEGPGHCPDQSKVGTVSIGSPALNGPLVGSLYLGEPKPGDQYRIFMVLSGFGINAKLVGSFRPDPVTGRVTAHFDDLPQVPFEEFDLHLFASDRGLMATPTRCTLYAITARFVPWNNTLSPQLSERFLSVETGPGGRPCPGVTRPFSPRLVAGTSTALAGAFSSFHLKLDRDDGDQFLGDLSFRMPPGFTGSLRGISYCPEGSITAAERRSGREERAQPSCPASSEIGTSNVAAGPGSHPFHAVGRMYLAGPLNGAPLSAVAITPALAGPYDYGNVVVRVALHVDPMTAQVTAVSEKMPQVIGGIPIRMRSIQVNIDKPDFTINPTNCEPSSIDSTGVGDERTVADFSSYFHAVNCFSLPFKPRMTIRQFGGRKETKRARNPRMKFDLYTRPGDANLKSVAVTLPKSLAIDQRHLFNICSKSQLERERCAGRQPIGNVMTKTPLLDQPLTGLAYAVSGFGKLPHVVFVLNGQVTVMPEATSSSDKTGRLRTVVPVIPDVPIGHFQLTLLGGKKGYLVNSRDLCKRAGTINIQYIAQSGRERIQKVRPKTSCGNG